MTRWGPWFLFSAVIVSHMALIHFVLNGVLWQWFICIGVYFFTGSLGMSATYHRFLSHRAWVAPRWFECMGTFWATIGLTGSSISWTAIHRAHHRHVDTNQDPHSPMFKGFWRSHFLSMFEKPNLKLVRELVRDPLHKAFHRHYLFVNFLWATFVYLLDPYAVIYAYLAPAAILWNGGSSINSVCHLWGYRNFETRDRAKNNVALGILTWGEGWHNNHHRFPRKAYFGFKVWEVDITGRLINLFGVK